MGKREKTNCYGGNESGRRAHVESGSRRFELMGDALIAKVVGDVLGANAHANADAVKYAIIASQSTADKKSRYNRCAEILVVDIGLCNTICVPHGWY